MTGPSPMSRRTSFRSCCERPALSRVNGCSTPQLVPASRPRPLLPWSGRAVMSRPPTSPWPWSTERVSAWPARRTPPSWLRTANRLVSLTPASTRCYAVLASCSFRIRSVASRNSIAFCARAGALQFRSTLRLSARTTVGSTSASPAACRRSRKPRREHSLSVTRGTYALSSSEQGSGTWRRRPRPTAPSSRNAGWSSLHPGQGSPGSYLPGHHRPNRSRALARRPEGGSSYSSTPMISGVTTSATKRKVLSVFALPSRSRTAPLRYSQISTAICGIFCSQTRRVVASPDNTLRGHVETLHALHPHALRAPASDAARSACGSRRRQNSFLSPPKNPRGGPNWVAKMPTPVPLRST